MYLHSHSNQKSYCNFFNKSLSLILSHMYLIWHCFLFYEVAGTLETFLIWYELIVLLAFERVAFSFFVWWDSSQYLEQKTAMSLPLKTATSTYKAKCIVFSKCA